MRIAVWHNLPSGGGKRALFHHVRGLVQRGHHVEVWCPSTADTAYLPLGELVPEHVLPLELREPSTRGLAGFFFHYRKVRQAVTAMDAHCRRCAKEIEAGHFDLLFANSCVRFGTPRIGRHVPLPKVLYLQEPFRWLYEALPRLPWAALPEHEPRGSLRRWTVFLRDLTEVQGYRIQVREELLSARAFDTILVNSFFSRESVLRAFGLDATVCYLGVDTTLFRPGAPPRAGYVIGLGAVTLGKGLERAVRAVAAVAAAIRPELVWVGNFARDDYRQEVEGLATALGVRLRLRIQVTDAELVDLLGRATALLYTPRLEPFGFAPLEASACGTPVIAIAEGGIRETVREDVNGLLVEHDDPAALAVALTRLLEDSEYASALGERARQYVCDHWSWETAVDRLEDCLRRTC